MNTFVPIFPNSSFCFLYALFHCILSSGWWMCCQILRSLRVSTKFLPEENLRHFYFAYVGWGQLLWYLSGETIRRAKCYCLETTSGTYSKFLNRSMSVGLLSDFMIVPLTYFVIKIKSKIKYESIFQLLIYCFLVHVNRQWLYKTVKCLKLRSLNVSHLTENRITNIVIIIIEK